MTGRAFERVALAAMALSLLAGQVAAAEAKGVKVVSARPAARETGAKAGFSVRAAAGEYTLDMAQLGIRPVAARLPVGYRASGPQPDSAAVHTAFMSVDPTLAQQSTAGAIATLLTNFAAAESVQYFINGALAGTFTASASGRLAIAINTAAGAGFVTFSATGVTSGRMCGGVAQILTTAPPTAFGVAVGPHAVNPNGTNTIQMFGRGYPLGGTVTLRRNGVSLGTIAASATTGRFNVLITLAAGADASAVYSSDNATAGSLVGQTVEERADAGTGSPGDLNLTRAFVDRAVTSTAVTTVSVTGEGFTAGETVNVTGCASVPLVADANGSVGFFLNTPGGAGLLSCLFTGATSARVARASVFADGSVTNVPGIIVQASNVVGAGTVPVLFSRLPPGDTGAVFLDGVSQGAASTDANGMGSFTLTKPTTGFVHNVAYVGTTDVVSGVLLTTPVELVEFSVE